MLFYFKSFESFQDHFEAIWITLRSFEHFLKIKVSNIILFQIVQIILRSFRNHSSQDRYKRVSFQDHFEAIRITPRSFEYFLKIVSKSFKCYFKSYTFTLQLFHCSNAQSRFEIFETLRSKKYRILPRPFQPQSTQTSSMSTDNR